MRIMWRVSAVAVMSLSVGVAAQAAQVFVPIAPCRVFDTRLGPPPALMAPGELRSFQVAGGGAAFAAQGGKSGGCGIPQGNPAIVKAVAFNFVAALPQGAGHITGWAFGGVEPLASLINYSPAAATGGLNIANGVVVPIAGVTGSPDIAIRANVSSTAVLADVTGYFVELDPGTGLEENESGPVTLGLLAGYRLPQSCTNGQIAAWNGTSWTCADDDTGGAGGAGTIESVGSPNGTIAVADGSGPNVSLEIAADHLLPGSCDAGDIPAWSGSSWQCATDADSGGTLESVASPGGSIVVTDGTGPDATLAIATTFALPQGCTPPAIAAWNGTSWECGTDTDTNSGGTIQQIDSPLGSVVVSNPGGPTTSLAVAASFALPQGCADGQLAAWDTAPDPDVWACVDPADVGGSTAVAAAYTARINDLMTSNGSAWGPATFVASSVTGGLAPSRIETLSPETVCAARNLRVRQVDKDDATPVTVGGTKQRTFSLMVDGVESALACTMTAAESTCVSTVTQDIGPGSRIAMKVVGEGGGSFNPDADALVSWECASGP